MATFKMLCWIPHFVPDNHSTNSTNSTVTKCHKAWQIMTNHDKSLCILGMVPPRSSQLPPSSESSAYNTSAGINRPLKSGMEPLGVGWCGVVSKCGTQKEHADRQVRFNPFWTKASQGTRQTPGPLNDVALVEGLTQLCAVPKCSMVQLKDVWVYLN